MATGISTRLLDHIPNNLFMIPEHVSSESAWLENGIAAVICRVDVPYADLNLGYTDVSNDIDGNGDRIVTEHTNGVQYPYFAGSAHLLEMQNKIVLNVKFNKEKHISCQQAA